MRFLGYWMLAMAIGLVGCAPESAEQLSHEAEAAYASGEFPRAIKHYEALIAEDGDTSLSHYNLALSAYRAQDYAYARQAAEKAASLAMDPEQSERCRELQGMVAEANKDLAGAAKFYRALLTAKDPVLKVRVHSRLARIYAQQNRLDGAFALLLSAANERTPDGATLYNLGKLCVREPFQLRSAAVDYFRQAERLLPKGTPQLRDAKDMIARLEANLKRLQTLPPNAGDTKASQAALKKAKDAQAKKRWTTAEKEAKAAMKADPSNFDAALLCARICTQNNKRTDAQKAFDAAIALRSSSVEARLEAADLAYSTKRYEDALTLLRPALVVQPKNITLADKMMRILAAQNKHADARVWGEYVLTLNPNATQAYRNWVLNLPEE